MKTIEQRAEICKDKIGYNSITEDDTDEINNGITWGEIVADIKKHISKAQPTRKKLMRLYSNQRLSQL